MQGKQPGPRHLLQKVNLEWFMSCSDLHREERGYRYGFHRIKNDADQII